MRRNRFYAIVKKGGFYNVTYGTVPHPYMKYEVIIIIVFPLNLFSWLKEKIPIMKMIIWYYKYFTLKLAEVQESMWMVSIGNLIEVKN